EVSFAGTSTTAAFLHGIALNLWRNELRKQTRRRWLLRLRGSSVEPQALPAASAQQEHDELQQRLRAALAALSPDLREAFVLRVLEQLPLAEAAALAEVSQATLSRRARRAEEQVRAHFLGDDSKEQIR
ncbi:MAG: sigma-70 family RNA polymerase sigma factor, partial [Myxococcales bacterium]|nr:sigma-70 family RNA polymerase sigma factor [Myxococcales bacterium]